MCLKSWDFLRVPKTPWDSLPQSVKPFSFQTTNSQATLFRNAKSNLNSLSLLPTRQNQYFILIGLLIFMEGNKLVMGGMVNTAAFEKLIICLGMQGYLLDWTLLLWKYFHHSGLYLDLLIKCDLCGYCSGGVKLVNLLHPEAGPHIYDKQMSTNFPLDT